MDSVTVPTSSLASILTPIVHLQHDGATNPGLESLQLDRYLVCAGDQERRSVDAGRVGNEGCRRVPADLADRDLCTGYELAARIDDRSDDASGGHLGGRYGEAVECDKNEETPLPYPHAAVSSCSSAPPCGAPERRACIKEGCVC